MSDILDNDPSVILKAILKSVNEIKTVIQNGYVETNNSSSLSTHAVDTLNLNKPKFPTILRMNKNPLKYYQIVGFTNVVELFDSISPKIRRELEAAILYKTVELTVVENNPNANYVFLFIPMCTQNAVTNVINLEILFIPNGIQNFKDEHRNKSRIGSFSINSKVWDSFIENSDYVIVTTTPINYNDNNVDGIIRIDDV